ncbi:beta-lactamase/transpeptidase-like protein [Cadophora sp. MPI-SDFR-AT-0126]|nr:beta-lactamase/transpeptidase-like protein [Leotiomycetes sp. MPI-SDFR-AT-0126]
MANLGSQKSRVEEALQATLQESVDAGVPGIVAAISSSKGLLWSSSAGYADIEDSKSANTVHVFGIGSITKVFVAVVILQLIEEKKLTLTTKLGDLLKPEILDGIANAADATIDRLLSHTSGVESWEDDPTWRVEGRGRDLDPARIWGKTDTLKYIRRPNPSGPKPGEWDYSNTGYTLLGLVIEKLTGNTAESEIRVRILHPLGMRSTYFEGFEEPGEGPVTSRYHWATETFIKEAGICPIFTRPKGDLINASASNLSVEWAAGGIVSSASDLLKFIISLRDRRLVSASSLDVMRTWQLVEGGTEQGHGIFRWPSPKGYGTWIGHHGGVLGFTASLWWKEEGDVAVCLLSNVGTMHCGQVPSSSGAVFSKSDFLKLATELSEGQT